jgi:hypothetical protein
MTNDLTLSRRAVACPGWRWLRGMTDTRGRTVLEVRDGVPWCASGPMTDPPDLTDPCTLGGLEALVRERWGEDVYLRPLHTHSHYDGPGTDLMPVVWWALARGNDMLTVPRDPDGTGTRRLAGPTRAAALVAALEAP